MVTVPMTLALEARRRTATRLFAGNVALLTTHQADAAYWHEWDVFGVPGGLPLFLVFNVVAVGLVAVGLVQVAEGAPSARRAAVLSAALGLFTVALHTVFLWRDRIAFWTPLSLAILVGILITSIAQVLFLPTPAEARRPISAA
jgi:hypothetical protein